jgi:hypothetical protein
MRRDGRGMAPKTSCESTPPSPLAMAFLNSKAVVDGAEVTLGL